MKAIKDIINALNGNTIQHVNLDIDNNMLSIQFNGGKTLTIKDAEQSCSEKRYITCDDNLDEFNYKGLKLLDILVKEGGGIHNPEEWGENHKEIAFVEIKTSAGSINLCTHNHHNGYYGGFDVEISLTSTFNLGIDAHVYDYMTNN